MRDYAFNAVPAGETRIINAPEGDFFRVLESPVKLFCEFETKGGNQSAQLTLNETGFYRFERSKFHQIRMTNMGLGDADFIVTLGDGETGDNVTAGAVETTSAPAAEFNGLPALVLTAGVNTIPANTNRRQLIVRASGGNAGTVWVGGSASEEGLPLDGLDVAEIDVNGDITVFADNAGDTLYLVEVV